ncbi:MAG: HlyD family efflux transporter periplasmic adaptor subunit [Bacteroidota bacterium]
MNIKKPGFLVIAAALSLLFSSCDQQETTLPNRKNIEDAVFASGYIEHENNYTVSTKAEGIITSLTVKEGDALRKNELVALLESDIQNNQLQDAIVVYDDAVNNASMGSPQLESLQVQIEQAKKQLDFDQENYLRYKDLWQNKSISKLEYEKVELQYKTSENNLIALQKNYDDVKDNLDLNVERSKVQLNTQQSKLKDYRLTSQEAGTVIDVFKKQGELARKGEAIAKIGSGDYIIKLFVAEEDITKVEMGQRVVVSINTYPDTNYLATITKIYPAFDKNEQSYVVEAQFENLPEKMFSGTQLQANIENNSRSNVLVIPTAYISKGNKVLLENGEERQIVTGSKNGSWTEVVSGLVDKDVIVKPKN